MIRSRYYMFPDREDWIVFSHADGLVFRTNGAAAKNLAAAPPLAFSPGPADGGADAAGGGCAPPPRQAPSSGPFRPEHVTIACSNRCGQACVYCYGTPVHENTSVLDPEFCRAALRWMAERKPEGARRLHAFFHGVGEPTFHWRVFRRCAEVAGEVGEETGVPFVMRLCTGGQLAPDKAEFVAARFHEVHVSMDGPPDLQNLQRPRRDGKDSSGAPMRLAREVLGAGGRVVVKCTVTAAGVGRMEEIVEFTASELGPVSLQLGMAFSTPYCDTKRFGPPDWRDYVRGFGKAFQKGLETGVRVEHPTIHPQMLVGQSFGSFAPHFCLAPPNIVTAFYDVPAEGSGDPRLGMFGHYDAGTGRLRIDEEKCRALPHAPMHPQCAECPCEAACRNIGGVKGRVPGDGGLVGSVCRARVGVLREMLRRLAPKQPNINLETMS